MAVYTFSAKESKPEDTELVERVKKTCDQRRIVFSGLILDLLREWEANEQRDRKV